MVLYLQPTCPKPRKGPLPQLSVVFPQSPQTLAFHILCYWFRGINLEVHTDARPPVPTADVLAEPSNPSCQAQLFGLPCEALPTSQPPQNTVPSLSELWLYGSQLGPIGGLLPHFLLPVSPLRQHLTWTPGRSEGGHMTRGTGELRKEVLNEERPQEKLVGQRVRGNEEGRKNMGKIANLSGHDST